MYYASSFKKLNRNYSKECGDLKPPLKLFVLLCLLKLALAGGNWHLDSGCSRHMTISYFA